MSSHTHRTGPRYLLGSSFKFHGGLVNQVRNESVRNFNIQYFFSHDVPIYHVYVHGTCSQGIILLQIADTGPTMVNKAERARGTGCWGRYTRQNV